MTYDDEINAGPELVIFGEVAERGRKVPSSGIKKIVTDGTYAGELVPSESDVIRNLIAAGANTLDEIERRWRVLLKKRAITVPFDLQVRRIARALLGERR